MRELGWVDGQNVVFHPHYMDEGPLPDLAAELVGLHVDVILTGAGDAVWAARDATSTIPIVAMVSDPVFIGLVPSYAHPGGNITGPSGTLSAALAGPKQLEILAPAVPGLAHLALLFNSANPVMEQLLSPREQVASTVGIQTLRFGVRSTDEFESAFAHMRAWAAQALLIISEDALVRPHNALIADLAVRSRLPSMAQDPGYVEAGGLMSYGTNGLANWVRAASYVDRILRGAKPGDLPIERPSVRLCRQSQDSSGAWHLIAT
jgi:putative ABC transport system substrate-binding protein